MQIFEKKLHESIVNNMLTKEEYNEDNPGNFYLIQSQRNSSIHSQQQFRGSTRPTDADEDHDLLSGLSHSHTKLQPIPEEVEESKENLRTDSMMENLQSTASALFTKISWFDRDLIFSQFSDGCFHG